MIPNKIHNFYNYRFFSKVPLSNETYMFRCSMFFFAETVFWPKTDNYYTNVLQKRTKA